MCLDLRQYDTVFALAIALNLGRNKLPRPGPFSLVYVFRPAHLAGRNKLPATPVSDCMLSPYSRKLWTKLNSSKRNGCRELRHRSCCVDWKTNVDTFVIIGIFSYIYNWDFAAEKSTSSFRVFSILLSKGVHRNEHAKKTTGNGGLRKIIL